MGSSMKVKIYSRQLGKREGPPAAKGTVRTRRHSSLGRLVNGSFFSRGLTKSCTKLSWWLLHMFSSSPSSLSFSASFMSLNHARTFLNVASSCSDAVLQSGARWFGVGLGAGVGGEAGAAGSRLGGILESIGLVGVCMGAGARVRNARFLVLEVADGGRGCATGRLEEEATTSSTEVISSSESVSRTSFGRLYRLYSSSMLGVCRRTQGVEEWCGG